MSRVGTLPFRSPAGGAVLACLLLGGLTAVLWWNVGQASHRRLQLETEVIADQVVHRIETLLQSRLSVVGYLAGRWNADFAGDEAAFRANALQLMQQFPGFRALNWVDAQTVIRVVVPLKGNEAALGRTLSQHPEPSVATAIRRAVEGGTATRTDATIKFLQGGKGFAVYWPVWGPAGQLEGLVDGVFEIETCIDLCLPEQRLKDRFRFGLYEHGSQPIDLRARQGDVSSWPHRVERELKVVDVPWTLKIAPSRHLLAESGHDSRLLSLAQAEAPVLVLSLLLYVLLLRRRALRRSQQRVEHLLDSTFEGIYGLDLQGRCTFSNPSCRRMLGYELPEDLLGQSMHALIHHTCKDGTPYPESECRIYQSFRKVESLHSDSELMWRRDGTSFPVQYHALPVSQDGVVTGAVVTFIDVSEREESQSKLLRLIAILDSTPDLVGMVDTEGRSVYINPAGRRMLGFGADEDLSMMTAAEFHPGFERERLMTEAFPTALGEGTWSGETVFVRRDGTELTTSQVILSHRDTEDGPAFYSTIARDITELRKLQDRVQVTQRLESLGVLAGGIAHDFNNLLVGIIGNASLALEVLDDRAAVTESLQAVEVAGRRAAELTEQLLAHAGKAHVERRVFDLNSLVAEMITLMETSIRSRARLDVTLCEQPCPISGDATQVRQIVMNLIANASDAVEPIGGSIEIRVSTMVVGDEGLEGAFPTQDIAAGEHACVEVTDNGCGIDEGSRHRIFEPFYTTKAKGRGLGLAAALGIVGTHGGALVIQGQPGEGTKARLVLPLWDGEVTGDSEQDDSHGTARGREGLILVIDDEPLVRDVLVRVLQGAGYETLDAGSGHEGLELFLASQGRVRAVILDKEMPGLNGAETLQRLKAIDPQVLVLLSTGHSEDPNFERALTQAAGFIKKPYRGQQLLAALAAVLSGHIKGRGDGDLKG